jgi:type I restriction enzyme S subunit
MEKNSNVPVLRFPGFAGDWRVDKLKSLIVSIDSGWSPQCEEYPASEDEWGILKTTSVVWEGFNEKENKKLPD